MSVCVSVFLSVPNGLKMLDSLHRNFSSPLSPSLSSPFWSHPKLTSPIGLPNEASTTWLLTTPRGHLQLLFSPYNSAKWTLIFLKPETLATDHTKRATCSGLPKVILTLLLLVLLSPLLCFLYLSWLTQIKLQASWNYVVLLSVYYMLPNPQCYDTQYNGFWKYCVQMNWTQYLY